MVHDTILLLGVGALLAGGATNNPALIAAAPILIGLGMGLKAGPP